MELEFDATFAENPGGGAGTISADNPFSNTFVLQTDATGPLWYVEDVEYPREVAANGAVDVSVEMANERTVITPLNEDSCVDGLTNGLESEIIVQPEWTDGQTVTDCLAAGGFTPTRRTHTFDFRAPTSPGTYTLSVEVRGTGSGEGGIETFEIVVPETGGDPRGSDGCDRNADCPEGQECVDGECVPTDGSSPLEDLINSLTLGTDSPAVPLVILVLILVALLYLTAI